MEAWKDAVIARDLDALGAAMTDDAALHSPITERIPFEGRARLLELFEEIFDLLGPMEILREVEDGDRRYLEIRAELAGCPLHQIQMLKLAPDGRVEDVTLFMRPMPGVVNLAAHIGPRLTRRRYGALAALFVAAFLRPIAFLVKLGDRSGPRFV